MADPEITTLRDATGTARPCDSRRTPAGADSPDSVLTHRRAPERAG